MGHGSWVLRLANPIYRLTGTNHAYALLSTWKMEPAKPGWSTLHIIGSFILVLGEIITFGASSENCFKENTKNIFISCLLTLIYIYIYIY